MVIAPPAPARRFAKVILPPARESHRIPLEGMGETLDPTPAFASEDAARMAQLNAAIAAEDAAKNRGKGVKRIEVVCDGCGDKFFARTDARLICTKCSVLGRGRERQRRNSTGHRVLGGDADA